MRPTVALLAVAAAVVLTAAGARATTYPNTACPDSVTIFQLHDGGACQPGGVNGGVGDTVRSVGGIVTGIDAIPSAFAFYLQNSSATPGWNTGLEVFTGSRDCSNGWRNGASGPGWCSPPLAPVWFPSACLGLFWPQSAGRCLESSWAHSGLKWP